MWAGAHPVYLAEAQRRERDRRGRQRVRRLLPRRHRARWPATRPAAGSPRRRAHDDAADRGRGVGGRGAGPALRRSALAVLAHRHRRQPLDAAHLPPGDGPPEGCWSSTGATTAPSTRRSSRSATTAWSRSRAGNVGPAVDPAETTRVAEFNDIESVEAALAHGDVACVLMEPALTNIGIVLPEAGFLEAVRAACTRAGTLLIIDETHTLSAGPGRLHRRLGPRARRGHARQVDRRRRADRRLRRDRRAGRADRRRRATPTTRTPAASAARWPATRSRWPPRARRSARCSPRTAFARMSQLRERFVAGVEEALERHSVPWSIVSLGARAEYRFCAEPPRTGAESAAAGDHDARGVSAPLPAQPRRADHARSTTWR